MRYTRPENRRYINDLVQLQRGTVEIVVIAIALAFGINLLSSALPQLMGISVLKTTLIGTVLIAFGIIYLALKAGPALNRAVKLRGVLTIDHNGEVIGLSRYEFGDEMRRYIRALTVENKAMERTWERARFGQFGEETSAAQERAEEEGNRMVREAIEYFALRKLSLHLSKYFVTDRSVQSDSVATIQRRNIPQLLLDNRFLELFSKPMKERAAFQHHHEDEDDLKDQGRRVVYATGSDGELFDQFELILPLGTVLSRTEEGALSIKTDRFTLKLTPVFQRHSTNLPRDFEELYLGKKFLEVHAHNVALEVDVSFGWQSVTTRKGWDYYEWLDSFLEELEKSFSFDDFVESIGWHTAHTSATISKNSNRTDRAKSNRPIL